MEVCGVNEAGDIFPVEVISNAAKQVFFESSWFATGVVMQVRLCAALPDIWRIRRFSQNIVKIGHSLTMRAFAVIARFPGSNGGEWLFFLLEW